MLNPLDYSFLLLIALFLPYVSIKGSIRARTGHLPIPNKSKLAESTLTLLAIMGALAIYVGWVRHDPTFPAWHPTMAETSVGLGLLAFTLALRYLLLPWMRKGKKLYTLVPTSWPELPGWGLICLFAGVFEEVVYRGTLYTVLLDTFHSAPLAIAVASIVFGAVHIQQGWRSALFVAAMAVSFHLLVIWSGTLYMAMLVHFTYDFLIGVISCLTKSHLPTET